MSVCIDSYQVSFDVEETEQEQAFSCVSTDFDFKPEIPADFLDALEDLQEGRVSPL